MCLVATSCGGDKKMTDGLATPTPTARIRAFAGRLCEMARHLSDPGWRTRIIEWIRQLFLAMYLAKFSVLMALLLSLVVAVPPQIGELIQLIGERASDDEDLLLNLVRYPGLFLLALGLFSFVCMRSAHL